MKTRLIIAAGLAALAVALVAVSWPASPGSFAAEASASQSGERAMHLPLLGIAPGQTLRVSLTHLGFRGRSPAPLNSTVEYWIVVTDTQGSVLEETRPIAVAAEHTGVIDVPRERLGRRGEPGTGRLEVRVVVRVRGATSGSTSFPISLQLMDQVTGRSVEVLWPGGVR